MARKYTKWVDNKIRVTGFNAQTPSYPELPENSRRWSQNIRWEAALKRDWEIQRKRAVWLGAGIGLLLSLASLGMLYGLH